ncbi:hypothetical protein V1478_005498 [Vespula squamosa]|uniref:Uncharacterized protein n=1 Tax=Vespula squamosa TaxID=30214 RepID=A0ABD2BEL7_VESSQ
MEGSRDEIIVPRRSSTTILPSVPLYNTEAFSLAIILNVSQSVLGLTIEPMLMNLFVFGSTNSFLRI